MTFDVIIPTYKPGEEFKRLLEGIKLQSVKPENIFVINTEKAYWNDEFEKIVPIKLIHIGKKDFDHGGTRRMAADMVTSEAFICMTQDARPVNGSLFEKLLRNFNDSSVGIAYARQETDEKAGAIEKYTREFNYPLKRKVKTEADIKTMGIKAWFCSDVCAAYRKKIYDEAGGFVKRTVFNEDMLMAAEIMRLGYKVVYEAEARVVHYHEYTAGEQFHRNFDLGASHKEFCEIFNRVSSEKEGGRLVGGLIKHLTGNGKIYLVPKVIWHSAAKYTGFRLGKIYDRLPKRLVMKFCMNKEYFK